MAYRIFALLTLTIVASPVALALDSDNDGIDNSFDNCATYANPLQLDSDRDGYGNRCDVDFNQSGLADGRDARFFNKMIRKQDPGADIDENGVVDHNDPIAAIPLWGLPPGPGAAPGDDDGDGVPLVQDACPDSQLEPPLARGCSAAELALAAPEVIGEPTAILLRNAVEGLVVPPEYDAFLSGLDFALRLLEQATHLTAGGDPCQGAFHAGRLGLTLSTLETELADRIRESEIEAFRNNPVPPGAFEWNAAEDATFHLHLMQSLFERGKVAAEQAVVEIQSICDDITGPVQVQGIIDSVDTQRGLMVLESGEILALADGYIRELDLEGHEWEPTPGVSITAEGQAFGNGAVMVAALRPDQLFPLTQFANRLCLQLQIRPVQLSPVYTGAPWILHSSNSYRESDGSRLQLERGMGIGVDTGACPTDVIGGRRSIYGARITLRIPGVSSILLANFLKDRESLTIPPLPATSLFGDVNFEIDITTRRMECDGLAPFNDNCSETVTVASRTVEAVMRTGGSYCSVDYNLTEFDVQTFGGHRASQVIGVTANLGPPTVDNDEHFNALGYPILSDGNLGTTIDDIGEGDRFAILADDFRDWHEANGTPLEFISRLTGTVLPSALVWPRLQGDNFRGGQYWYSCRLPRITRDVITYCSGFPNTHFTSPLKIFSQITQGAFSPNPPHKSHNNAYAWDFTAALQTPVYAARSGRVKLRRNGDSENCPGGSCLGNRVILEHQDGTVANYLHLDAATVGPLNTWVERGELVGLSGNTGVSNGPHLHFGHEFGGNLLDPDDDVATPALFHVSRFDENTLEFDLRTCYEPQEDDNIGPRDP